MGNLETLIFVFIALLGVGVVLYVVLPHLERKGINVKNVIDQTQKALDTVGTTMETLRPFLPEGKGTDAFDKIMKAAVVGVNNAEQLYAIGQLKPEARKEAAREYVSGAVALMGVEVTPEVERLIDGAIEAEVRCLKL